MSKKSKIIMMISSLLLLTIICPVLMGCLYATPSADDFTNSIGWQNYEEPHLKYMLLNLINSYKSWQGTYFGSLICGFPVYYKLGLTGFRIWLLGAAILFCFSSFLFVISFVRWLGIKDSGKYVTTLIYTALFLLYILGTNNLDEIFYWYTGACVYTLPVCFSLLCISFYMLYETNKKKISLVLGIIFAFLGAGGALDIAALLCSLLLFGFLYNYLVLEKISRSFLIGLTALSGAIINVAAPGNFVRHATMDEKIRPLMSIANAILRVNNVISSDFRKGLILAIIIVSFVIAFEKLEKDVFMFKYPGLVTIYCYIAILVTDFPIFLGYSSAYLPGRCAFVEHISIAIYTILASVYWAGWVKNNEIFKFTKEIYLTLAIICIIPLSAYFDVSSLKELTPYKMTWHLAKGDYKTVSKKTASIIEQIEESSEPDVIVYITASADDEWTNIKPIGLSEDSAYWVNTGVAQYYGKSSITIQYTE